MEASERDHVSQVPSAQARALVRSSDRGALATAMNDNSWPYVSLVMMACDVAANPLMMISELAEHTRNILRDDRVALLVDGTAGLDNPLTGARVTLVGRAVKTADPALDTRYIARHPGAAVYAGFADFALYRLVVERVHMVAGFGAIHWIDKADYLFDPVSAADLIAAEADIVRHMNEDHAEAVQLLAASLPGRAGEGWIMTGVDPEGCDLRNAGAVARLPFDSPVTTAEEARAVLIMLVGKARETG